MHRRATIVLSGLDGSNLLAETFFRSAPISDSITVFLLADDLTTHRPTTLFDPIIVPNKSNLFGRVSFLAVSFHSL